ncbi:uncharacterized protein LOC122988133 isoform X1 [Thunnus albacares]|uniref:uncharacterized protein LOC122988133 isoform X1 n=2 Tax=Thunnus albacares TaxID=8236 RepID=UPI001CF71BDF|nr:uncharacterized protein LOC122988133 isoform X1 [Thunnus albacares]
MQKGFIFLLIICNSAAFTPGKNTHHLRFSLGCSALIPCQHKRGDSNLSKWFYKKDENGKEIHIFSKGKGGVPLQHQSIRGKMTVAANGSLVINSITEDNQGLYCCVRNDSCKYTVVSVEKEIINETYKTFYVTAGSSFMHECPGEVKKWTFKANNTTNLKNSLQGLETEFVTSNKTIHIVNVKRAEAGKYTCWTSKCDGHTQKLLTINLCVITVQHSEDSSVSCVVMCDMEFKDIKPNSTSNVKTGTVTISVLVDPNGFLNCNAKQMLDGYSTVNSTHEPSIASNKTTGTHTEPEYLTPAIYGSSAGIACLILVALLICCLRRKLQADLSVSSPGCGMGNRVQEETSVVYSSIVIRRPAKTANNQMTYSDCVYSEINV